MGQPDLAVSTLANKLTVVLAPDDESTTVAMATTWRAGFHDDPPAGPGLAHLVEHLMFHGTERYSRRDYYRTYVGWGGYTNAYTRSGHTTYHAEFPEPRLADAVELEADRFNGSTPTAQQIQREAGLVSAEIDETTGARPLGGFPWEHVQRLLFADFAHAHNGYVTPPVTDATAGACREFVANRYRPEHAAVVLAGRFDPATAIDLLAGMARIERTGAAPGPPTPSPRAGGSTVVDVPANSRDAMARAWHVGHADAAIVVLAAIVQGNGPSSLAWQLGDQGIHGVVRADFGMFGEPHELPDSSYLTLQAYHAGTNPRAVASALTRYVDGLAADPPTDAEVAAVSAALADRHRRPLADPLGRARRIAEHTSLWHDPRRPWTFVDQLANVTAADVAAKAESLAAAPYVEARTRSRGGGDD